MRQRERDKDAGTENTSKNKSEKHSEDEQQAQRKSSLLENPRIKVIIQCKFKVGPTSAEHEDGSRLPSLFFFFSAFLHLLLCGVKNREESEIRDERRLQHVFQPRRVELVSTSSFQGCRESEEGGGTRVQV